MKQLVIHTYYQYLPYLLLRVAPVELNMPTIASRTKKQMSTVQKSKKSTGPGYDNRPRKLFSVSACMYVEYFISTGTGHRQRSYNKHCNAEALRLAREYRKKRPAPAIHYVPLRMKCKQLTFQECPHTHIQIK